MLKNTLFILFLCGTSGLAAQTWAPVVGVEKMKIQDQIAPAARFFPVQEVQLTDSPFKKAMDLDVAYLLSLEPDRLLHRFHLNAGLPVKGAVYGGWESMGISGHSLGHYLSALALGWAATQDARLLDKLNYTIDELERCQNARGTGYVGGIPAEDSAFAQIAAGNITSDGFDLNGLWVPWYTIHKVLAGLEDAYLYADNPKALQIATRLGDWAVRTTSNLTEADWQKMLACEHGGMNETLANLYALTGDARFLALSLQFHHKTVLDPLARREDILPGKHANTQIPKIIGCMRRYELTGHQSDLDIADFFWETVVQHHSYANGGNSNHEHFGKPDALSDELSESSSETCNTNNMLKLTRLLFALAPSAAYMDYYERALYNHILASQNPADGMMCYYIPLQAGGQKKYSTPFDDFWCCVGTGIENHVKYGESIYAKGTDGALYVNLFIPSVLNWKERGLTIRQETHFPETPQTTLIFSGAKKTQKFPIHLRFPTWADAVTVLVNGKKVNINAQPGSLITLDRKWKNGDRLEMRWKIQVRSEVMPDNPDRWALLYGPLLLAGALGTGAFDPVYESPVLVTDDKQPAHWLAQSPTQPLAFETKGIGYPHDVQLMPFYQMHGQRYTVYFDFFTKNALEKRQLEYETALRLKKDIEVRTIDELRIGEMQPERDHSFAGERTFTGEHSNRKWRDAREGGWFAFDLKCSPEMPSTLQCDYWGSDAGNRVFDILIDGQKIATQALNSEHPNRFYTVDYPIPMELTRGKNQVRVQFQALPGATAGGLYGVRIFKNKQ